MKWILKLLGLQKGDRTAVGQLALDIREAIKGKELDPETALKYIHELNTAEAQHRSIFVAGWRPFIGWICGTAFAYHYILLPTMKSIVAYHGIEVDWPVLETDQLFTVLMGMLGLGGLRTYEKMKGKA